MEAEKKRAAHGMCIAPFCDTTTLPPSPPPSHPSAAIHQGILTGRWTAAEEVPGYRKRSRHFGPTDKSRHGEDGHEALLFKTVNALTAIAAESGMPLARIALAWPLATDAVCCVIAGATKESQVDSNAVAAGTVLSPELLAKLEEATAELKEAMGSNCDMWQGAGDGRIM